jgi:hypothetical protein
MIKLVMAVCFLNAAGVCTDWEYPAYDYNPNGSEMFSTRQECLKFSADKAFEFIGDGGRTTHVECTAGPSTKPQLPEGWRE